MMMLYFLFSLVIVFTGYSAVIEPSSPFNQSSYNTFAKECKFNIPLSLYHTPNDTFMAQSNIDCLSDLTTAIDKYLEIITDYKNQYESKPIHYLDVNPILKKFNDNITNVKLKTVKAKSLFNVFDKINFDLFDPVNSPDDCQNCFKNSYYNLLRVIQYEATRLLDTIQIIRGFNQHNHIEFDQHNERQDTHNMNQTPKIVRVDQKNHDESLLEKFLDEGLNEFDQQKLNSQDMIPDLDLDESVKTNDILDSTLQELISNTQKQTDVSNNQLNQRKNRELRVEKSNDQNPRKPTPHTDPNHKNPEKNRWWSDNRRILVMGTCFCMISIAFLLLYFQKSFANAKTGQYD